MIEETLPSSKVLSVRQPHAHLLVSPHPKAADVPIKWCENRTWKPDLKQLKPSPLKEDAGLPRILIHASSNVDRNAFDEDEETGRWWKVPKYFQELDLEKLPKSAIIGSVRLLGIVDACQLCDELGEADSDETPREEFTKLRAKVGLKTSQQSLKLGVDFVEPVPLYEGEELFWWFLDRPMRLANPIQGVKGMLNLWNYPE